MGDADGPVLATLFYQELIQKDRIDADDIAYALDHAVNHLRRSGVPVHRWATFIHLGA
jgi:hypothetical protein